MNTDADLSCFRCGASLKELTPPISRHDECPSCAVYLHVCRMCRFFASEVARQCTEDDAEEVLDKERLNFCEWYKPSATAFDPQRGAAGSRAKDELAALFGESDAVEPSDNAAMRDAEDLFK